VPAEDGSNDLEMPAVRWFVRRLRRHVTWAREQGLGRLIEEDQLNPFERLPTALRKVAWKVSHDASPRAVPVFLVGLQRSGTNMIVRGLERSPQFEVHNENDRAAFHRFRLRPDPVIKELVVRSRHPFVLFKPLCDSHRVGDLLDHLETPSPGRAIWLVRSVDDRVRSSVEKFGGANLRALRLIADGRGGELWQGQGLSEESLTLIRSFDYDRLSPWSASALFWYVRNAILFERGLHERPDLVVVAYERVLEEPRASIQQLCRFLGVPYEDRFAAHVSTSRRVERPPLDIDPEIRRRCDELGELLDRASAAGWSPAEPAA
jgi:hypothetical protein